MGGGLFSLQILTHLTNDGFAISEAAAFIDMYMLLSFSVLAGAHDRPPSIGAEPELGAGAHRDGRAGGGVCHQHPAEPWHAQRSSSVRSRFLFYQFTIYDLSRKKQAYTREASSGASKFERLLPSFSTRHCHTGWLLLALPAPDGRFEVRQERSGIARTTPPPTRRQTEPDHPPRDPPPSVRARTTPRGAAPRLFAAHINPFRVLMRCCRIALGGRCGGCSRRRPSAGLLLPAPARFSSGDHGGGRRPGNQCACPSSTE